jgi:hypothetical protein
MDKFRFANLPSHSSVAAGVTMLVSAWFLVAAGSMIADPHADGLRVDPPRDSQVALVPEHSERIVVTASRSAQL